MRSKRIGLTGTAIKSIALFLMVLDHIYYFFHYTGIVPIWYNMLGRLSAPLFLFCAVEGFAHTHDRRRYFIRLWLVAAGMGVITCAMVYADWLRRPDGFYPINGIFLNFVVLCIIWQGIDWMREGKYRKGILAIAGPWAWGLVVFFLSMIPSLTITVLCLGCSVLPAWPCIIDGGFVYIIGGIILYLFRNQHKLQLICWGVWIFCSEFLMVLLGNGETSGISFIRMFTEHYQWFSIAAIGIMALYNGRRGAGHKQLFYWFYPLHVYLLYALSWAAYLVLD